MVARKGLRLRTPFSKLTNYNRNSDYCSSSVKREISLRKPHVCRNCDKHFVLSEYLKNHIKTQHECGKFFSRTRNYKMKMRVMTNEGTYACPTCEKCFDTFHQWRRHVEIHRCGESHTCHIFGGCVPRLRRTREQIKLHISRSMHSCSRCRKTGLDLLKIKRPFICTICKKSYTSAFELERHLVVHVGEKQHVCTRCDDRFSTLTALTLHLGYYHAVNARNVCSVCGIRFFHVEHLRIHSKVHACQNCHACKDCGKLFMSVNLLKRHQSVHASIPVVSMF